MQLTKFTDYSLRVLIAVGLEEGRGLTVGRIAEQFGISRNHLMKVVHRLSRAGYLETVRGRGGGLSLAVPPESIGLGALVRETETDFQLVPCFDTGRSDACPIVPACVLKRALQRGVREFLQVLDEYTLADLIRPERKLRALLLSGSAAQPAERA